MNWAPFSSTTDKKHYVLDIANEPQSRRLVNFLNCEEITLDTLPNDPGGYNILVIGHGSPSSENIRSRDTKTTITYGDLVKKLDDSSKDGSSIGMFACICYAGSGIGSRHGERTAVYAKTFSQIGNRDCVNWLYEVKFLRD